ncbi:MAG: hypothetical protein K0041_08440 [Acidithiobacillus sp.]|nr:hypothetical protein [Acidithiobacillus sp.]
MDSIQIIRKICNSSNVNTTDCLVILDALLSNQEQLDQRWHRLLADLQDAKPDQLLAHVLAVDQELRQYRRAMIFLRANLASRIPKAHGTFFVDSRGASG